VKNINKISDRKGTYILIAIGIIFLLILLLMVLYYDVQDPLRSQLLMLTGVPLIFLSVATILFLLVSKNGKHNGD
jgi:uncharacterized membrane protein YwaF